MLQDSSDQFLFFCTNEGNERFLKEEIRLFYPDLAISFSSKRFITYKNKGIRYKLQNISEIKVAFATRVGIFVEKVDSKNFEKKVEQIAESFNFSDFDVHKFNPLKPCEKLYSGNSTSIIDAVYIKENEIWLGVHLCVPNISKYPNSDPLVELIDGAPSRSYLKIKELALNFNLNLQGSCLDIGCSPGGVSFYLLEQGCSIWGVDPASVNETILKDKRFEHIQKPIQDLSQEELPRIDMDWILVDVNINPKQAIKEVLRLAKMYHRRIKGIIFTVNLIKLDHIKNLEFYEDAFYDWGFDNVFRCQVPSQKKEFTIIALQN